MRIGFALAALLGWSACGDNFGLSTPDAIPPDGGAVALHVPGDPVALDRGRPGATAASQLDLQLASSGTQGLATWYEPGRGIVATRIDREGWSLDGKGFALAADHGWGARVGAGPEGYLVTWNETSRMARARGDVRAQFIAPDGKMWDPFAVAIGDDDDRYAAAAPVAGAWAIAWQRVRTDVRAGAELWLGRFDRDGNALADAAPVDASSLDGFAIAGLGDRGLLVWTEAGRRVRTVSIHGAIAGDPSTIAEGDDILDTATVTASERGFVVAWLSRHLGAVRVVWLDPNGSVLTHRDLRVPDARALHVAVAGLFTYVSWKVPGEAIGLVRFGPDGGVLGRTLLPYPAMEGALAAIDGGALVGLAVPDPMSETDGTAWTVRIVAPGTAPAPAEFHRLRIGPAMQITPTIAGSPDGVLAAWCDSSGDIASGWDLRVATVDPGGDTGLAHAIVTAAGPDCAPALASAPGMYLMAWVDRDRRVEVTRLDASGAALDATPEVLGADVIARPLVSFDRDGFLLVWQERAPKATAQTIRAARVSTDGRVHDVGFDWTTTAATLRLAGGEDMSLLVVTAADTTVAFRMGAYWPIGMSGLPAARDPLVASEEGGWRVVGEAADGSIVSAHVDHHGSVSPAVTLAAELPRTSWALADEMLLWTTPDGELDVALVDPDDAAGLGRPMVVADAPVRRIALTGAWTPIATYERYDGDAPTTWTSEIIRVR